MNYPNRTAPRWVATALLPALFACTSPPTVVSPSLAPGAKAESTGGPFRSAYSIRGVQPGPLKPKRCPNAAADCELIVKAQRIPSDIDDDDDKACAIRVREAMVLSPATRFIVWNLHTKAIDRGFTFRDTGIAIDDGAGFFDPPTVSAAQVRVPVKTGNRGFAFSYTVLLKWSKDGMTADCDGLDPIIVNRDN